MSEVLGISPGELLSGERNPAGYQPPEEEDALVTDMIDYAEKITRYKSSGIAFSMLTMVFSHGSADLSSGEFSDQPAFRLVSLSSWRSCDDLAYHGRLFHYEEIQNSDVLPAFSSSLLLDICFSSSSSALQKTGSFRSRFRSLRFPFCRS